MRLRRVISKKKRREQRWKTGTTYRMLALAMVCIFLAGQSAWAQELDVQATDGILLATQSDSGIVISEQNTGQEAETDLKEAGYQTGDLNDDGSIDLLDLMMCLNHVAKKNELAENAYLAADVNEDGKVDLLDLMQILNYVSKKITEFSGSSEQHKHSYTVVVTKEATCAENGIKTFTCSECGESYTESIPATGEHIWTHYDAEGHTEEVLVSEAYDETVKEYHYVCNQCGFDAGIDDVAIANHLESDCINYSSKLVSVTVHHDAIYEEQWVQDSAAYDKCTVCGITR